MNRHKRITIKDLVAEGHTRAEARACLAALRGRGPKITYTPPPNPRQRKAVRK